MTPKRPIEPLKTRRLRLVPGTLPLARLERDDRGAFFRALGVPAPSAWPPPLNDERTVEFFVDQLEDDETSAGWWLWYILFGDGAQEVLAGSMGFKGPPTEAGDVEVGYSILEPFQGRGIATEALAALIAWGSASPKVRRILAHTAPGARASQAVLLKSGFHLTGPGFEEGAVLFARPPARRR